MAIKLILVTSFAQIVKLLLRGLQALEESHFRASPEALFAAVSEGEYPFIQMQGRLFI
jgi:uncharacterized protein YceH (UPF0502 family)